MKNKKKSWESTGNLLICLWFIFYQDPLTIQKVRADLLYGLFLLKKKPNKEWIGRAPLIRVSFSTVSILKNV